MQEYLKLQIWPNYLPLKSSKIICYWKMITHNQHFPKLFRGPLVNSSCFVQRTANVIHGSGTCYYYFEVSILDRNVNYIQVILKGNLEDFLSKLASIPQNLSTSPFFLSCFSNIDTYLLIGLLKIMIMWSKSSINNWAFLLGCRVYVLFLLQSNVPKVWVYAWKFGL